jgi:hypothetical protein
MPSEPPTAVFAPEEDDAPAPSAPQDTPPDPLLVMTAPEGDDALPDADDAAAEPADAPPGPQAIITPADEAAATPLFAEEGGDEVPIPDITALFPPEEVEAEARLPFEDTDRSAPPAERLPDAGLEPPQERTQITPARQAAPGYIIPPAPFTPLPVAMPLPPPGALMPPAPIAAHGPVDPGLAYVQQRVADYMRGGYRLHSNTPTWAVLSCGKNLGVGGWMLALISLIGFAWYLLTLALSGFAADRIYITLEADGRVYEDGPGAAHVRRGRARAGRRWAVFGGAILALSLLLALVLGAVAWVYLSDDTRQAALRQAYPAITLFEERFSAVEADPDDVGLAHDGFLVWVLLFVIALVGVWGGATLVVIGTVHHGAYRVPVPSLPGWG